MQYTCKLQKRSFYYNVEDIMYRFSTRSTMYYASVCVKRYLFYDCDRRRVLPENGAVQRPEQCISRPAWLE